MNATRLRCRFVALSLLYFAIATSQTESFAADAPTTLPQKYRQFEIPAVNVNRENVAQVVHDYIESTPKYDLSDFFAQWSVAIP